MAKYITKKIIEKLKNDPFVNLKVNLKNNDYWISIGGNFDNPEGNTFSVEIRLIRSRAVCSIYVGMQSFGTYKREIEINWSAWGGQDEERTVEFLNGIKLARQIGKELLPFTYKEY